MILGLDHSILHLVIVARGWNAGDLVVGSLVLFHLELHVVLHVMLAKHGVATGPWRNLLHPVLVVTLHLPVIVDLAAGWQDGQLGAINDISDA